MDLEYMSRVLMRLRPFVRDGVIRRTRLERVLGTLDSPPDTVRPQVERLLAKARIRIDEDQPPGPDPVAPVPVPTDQAEPVGPVSGAGDAPDAKPGPSVVGCDRHSALEAARSRILADREVVKHSSILLTAQQEVGLALLVRGPEAQPLDQGGFASLTGEAREAAECLFLHNQRLVHSVAQKYPQIGMNYEDIVQHGMTGLIRAVELFDPDQGNKFSTYAMWWIRQSITRGIANEARLIRLPVHMVERVRKVRSTQERLTVVDERPSIYRLAQACELDEKQVLECLRLSDSNLFSLDAKVFDGELTLADALDKSDPELDPWRQLEHALLREQLTAVLDTLAEREAAVISLRFGLTTGEPMTLDEIGKIYAVTRERIRQIETKTLEKLRHPSRSKVLEAYVYGGGRRAHADAPLSDTTGA